MGKVVSLFRGFNPRMQRTVFCLAIISAARHTGVSANLNYLGLSRTGEELPQVPNSLWERSNRPINAWLRDHPEYLSSFPKEYKDDLLQQPSKSNEESTPVQDDNIDYGDGNNVSGNFDQVSEEESNVLKAILTPDSTDEILFLGITAGFSVVAVVSLISLFICWFKLHRNSKATADVEYPAYGVTGPNKELSPTGDRRLAQSAQMYHYQHQKQQIIAMESSRANNERRGSVSEADSDEENEEGDYTVYECPGLAAQTGEMEVKNPLFQDDPTPAPAPAMQATKCETK